MNSLKRAKSARLTDIFAALISATIGVASLVLVNHFMDVRDYPWLAASFIVSAAGFYGAVFLLLSAIDRAIAIRLIPVAQMLGTDNVTEIAESLGWREDACAKYIAKCKKWKYL